MTLKKDINLTNNEKRILIALSKKDKFSPQDLAQVSELSIEASMQSAFMLAEKTLCEVKETITTTYSLTKEGEQYAQISLPERQVMDSIKAPILLSDLKKKFPPQMVGIALGWLRKKNWVKIEGDRIIPLEKAEVGEDETILSKLKKGPHRDHSDDRHHFFPAGLFHDLDPVDDPLQRGGGESAAGGHGTAGGERKRCHKPHPGR